jgi:hypothetical protein
MGGTSIELARWVFRVTEIEGREGAAELPAPEAPVAAPEETYLADGPTRRSRLLIVVAAVLLVAATFLGVLAAGTRAELDRERDERRQVEQVAARFATAFVTYDYRSLDGSLARIKRDATAKFGGEYERLFRTSLSTLIRETKARSTGTVTDVFLGSVDGETASALIVVNVEREGAAGRLPVAGTYFQMDLVEQNGRWKVDNVTSINFTQSAGPSPDVSAPTAPPATTTTSVPK